MSLLDQRFLFFYYFLWIVYFVSFRRIVLFLVLPIVFIGLILIFFLRNSDPASKIYNDLASCSSSWESGVPDSDPSVQCRIDVMASAFIDHGPNTPAIALDALTTDFPEYWFQCHYELHRAGEIVAENVDYLPYIASMRNNICHSGIIHGIFDYIGKSATDDSGFVSVTKVCDDLYGNSAPLVYSECSHSLGHALWMFYDSFDDSLPYCKALAELSGANNCVFGLFMQAYAPINAEPGVVYTSSDHSSEISAICDSWKDPETFEGCMIGAGYVYTRPYSNIPYSEYSSGFYGDSLTNVLNLTETMLDSCAKHSKGSDLCVREITKQIPIPSDNVESIEPICDLTGKFSRENLCSVLS